MLCPPVFSAAEHKGEKKKTRRTRGRAHTHVHICTFTRVHTRTHTHTYTHTHTHTHTLCVDFCQAFGIVHRKPSSTTRKTLTQIAKLLQNMANKFVPWCPSPLFLSSSTHSPLHHVHSLAFLCAGKSRSSRETVTTATTTAQHYMISSLVIQLSSPLFFNVLESQQQRRQAGKACALAGRFCGHGTKLTQQAV